MSETDERSLKILNRYVARELKKRGYASPELHESTRWFQGGDGFLHEVKLEHPEEDADRIHGDMQEIADGLRKGLAGMGPKLKAIKAKYPDWTVAAVSYVRWSDGDKGPRRTGISITANGPTGPGRGLRARMRGH